MTTVHTIGSAFAGRGIRSEDLTRAALERANSFIARSIFTVLFEERATRRAAQSDRRHAHGQPASSLDGIPVSVKDSFDIAGIPTTCGSQALSDDAPAPRDARAVEMLEAAGAIVLGRTNMSEFGLSSLGLNRAYGTPENVWNPGTPRVPGGSSSGAALSVARGITAAAIATDTGGSVRIPAAANGLVGYKPSRRLLPRDGAFTVATTLDSIGVIARTVECCAEVASVLSKRRFSPEPRLEARNGKPLRLALPTRSFLFADLDPHVASTMERALDRIARAGAVVECCSLPALDRMRHLVLRGVLLQAEAYAKHRAALIENPARYDARVRSRLELGENLCAADYVDAMREREHLGFELARELKGFDAWLAPTLPCVPPEIEPLENSDCAYFAASALLSRNTSVVNLHDGCAVTIPCHRAGEAPVGLMVAAASGKDRELLGCSSAIEKILNSSLL